MVGVLPHRLATFAFVAVAAAGAPLRGQRTAEAESATIPPEPSETSHPSRPVCGNCGPPATVRVTTCGINPHSTCTHPVVCSDQLLVSINGGPDGTANMKDLGRTLGMSYSMSVPDSYDPVRTVRLARHGREGLLDGWQMCGLVVEAHAGTWTWSRGTGVWFEDSCPTNTDGFAVSFTWTWPSGNTDRPVITPVVDCSDDVITHDNITAAPAEEACVALGNDCWRTRYTDADANYYFADGHYGNFDACTIPIDNGPRRIQVLRFDTEEDFDYLYVDGTGYSGTIGPDNVIARNDLEWRANAEVTRSGWHICLHHVSDFPTGYPSSGFPSTGFPSSGFPSTGFPSSGFPTGFPSQPTGAGPVTLTSCTARPGQYSVDGVQRNSPCFLNGRSRHVDHVSTYGDSAHIYTCSIGTNNHHFVFCTCHGEVCGLHEEPRNCFVPADNSMGCVGRLRGAAFSGDGTKAFFACSKEVRVCTVDRGSRNGNWYSGCQVVQDAGCPRWAGIRGIATRPRPNRGDLLVVVCTDWKTRSCSLHTDNMQMQPGRRCVKGGRERLCDGIGKPTAIAFSSANRLIVPCDSGYTYSRFVGGIVTDPVHTAYNGAAPCPHETMAIIELDPGRALVACGPNGVRECQLQYA